MRLKASTLIEVVASMVIFTIIFTIAFQIIGNLNAKREIESNDMLYISDSIISIYQKSNNTFIVNTTTEKFNTSNKIITQLDSVQIYSLKISDSKHSLYRYYLKHD
jgi:type II secretory pathway pseudopilin PulG